MLFRITKHRNMLTENGVYVIIVIRGNKHKTTSQKRQLVRSLFSVAKTKFCNSVVIITPSYGLVNSKTAKNGFCLKLGGFYNDFCGKLK